MYKSYKENKCYTKWGRIGEKKPLSEEQWKLLWGIIPESKKNGQDYESWKRGFGLVIGLA